MAEPVHPTCINKLYTFTFLCFCMFIFKPFCQLLINNKNHVIDFSSKPNYVLAEAQQDKQD